MATSTLVSGIDASVGAGTARLVRRAWLAGAVLAGVALACVAGPWLVPYHPNAQASDMSLASPTSAHPMGTDLLGRDLLARVLVGGQMSLMVGLLAAAVSCTIGVAYGAASGLAGGRVDGVMMRIVDVMYGMPYMLLVIVLMTVFGRSMVLLFVAIGCVSWLTMARIVRAQAVSLRQRPFVEAARAIGTPWRQILTRHIIRNLLGPVVAYGALTVPSVMLQEAFLSFLGLGVQPPDPSWGTLVADGLKAVTPVGSFWWLIAFPSAALVVTLVCLNVLGDALRDLTDPRTRHGR